MKQFWNHFLATATVLTLACACGSPSVTQGPRDAQLYNTVQTAPSTLKPLIIEWSDADRGALENRFSQGAIAIRFANGQIEILDNCRLPGTYSYRGFTRKSESQVLTTEKELDANFSWGAARLGAVLKKYEKLHVSVVLVGRHELQQSDEPPAILNESCQGATHIIRAASVGAFRFFSGTGRLAVVNGGTGPESLGGARANAGNIDDFYNEDGNFDRCELSSARDSNSPDGCSAVVRLELQKIGEDPAQKNASNYSFGTVTFNPRLMTEKPSENAPPAAWHNGPDPLPLCNELDAIADAEPFTDLRAYCRTIRTGEIEVAGDHDSSRRILSSVWYFYELPADNLFTRTLDTITRILAAADKKNDPEKKALRRLSLNIIALLHWHELNRPSPDPVILEKAAAILSPLRGALSEKGVTTDDQWWAAHLLTVSGLEDHTAKLATTWPFRFASFWHVQESVKDNPEGAIRFLPGLLERLPECDPLRLELMGFLSESLRQIKSWDEVLKAEIRSEITAETLGRWNIAGSDVFQTASNRGAVIEAENYIRQHPWVYGDFLWEQAHNCFMHDDYLCFRRILYRILQETPNAPVVPLVWRSLIEVEAALGDRTREFQLKMDEPAWTMNSDWARKTRSVPRCEITDAQMTALIEDATNNSWTDDLISRDEFVMTGRTLESWTTLVTIGNAVSRCLLSHKDKGQRWIKIVRAVNRSTVTVEASDPSKTTASCIAATLEDLWEKETFGVSIDIRLTDENAWPQDPATGWSEIDRYQLSCDAGEIEGCYQLALTYEKDPERRRESRQKSAAYLQKSCTAGHAEACAHEKSH